MGGYKYNVYIWQKEPYDPYSGYHYVHVHEGDSLIAAAWCVYKHWRKGNGCIKVELRNPNAVFP